MPLNVVVVMKLINWLTSWNPDSYDSVTLAEEKSNSYSKVPICGAVYIGTTVSLYISTLCQHQRVQ